MSEERIRSQSPVTSAVLVMQIATGQIEEEQKEASKLAEYIQQGLLDDVMDQDDLKSNNQ